MLVFSISFGTLIAQSNNLSSFDKNDTSRYGAFTYYSNPHVGIDGTVYLYDDWNHSVVVHTSDNKKLLIKNVNLNLMQNSFEAKIAEDSIFSFNFNNIEKFVLNNKEYKNFYYDDDNRVYELIYNSENLSVLKGFKINLIEASANPMNNRPRDRYVQASNYYLRKDGKIKPFTLKKNKILKIFEDPKKVIKIKEYVESNKLSYSNEYDVKLILKYYEYMNSAVVNK